MQNSVSSKKYKDHEGDDEKLLEAGPRSFSKAYGDKLRDLRHLRRWDQKYLAAMAGVSLRSLKYWEKGYVPTKPRHMLLMQALQPSFQEFVVFDKLLKGLPLEEHTTYSDL